MPLIEARSVLFSILMIQFFGNCVSLALRDKGVCVENTSELSSWLYSSRSGSTQKNIRRIVCCDQYEYDSDLDQCLPTCSLGCINGICTDVDICTCAPPLTLVGHTCVPSTCSNCEHGSCIAPNDCRCHKGYMKSNGTCAPICNEVCVNGQCTEPNKCKCKDGYRADPNNTFKCNPICEPECVHGTCTAHNKCTCNEGYEETKSNSLCKPTCIGCDFGQCIAPNNCSCFEGYEHINSTCEPKCSSCSNKDCVAPEECRSPIIVPLAEEGYTPTCSPPCIDGNCPISNQCFCNKGYDLMCSVTCSHGYCSRPDNCTCKPKKKGAIFKF